jgi:hypothetical protein
MAVFLFPLLLPSISNIIPLQVAPPKFVATVLALGKPLHKNGDTLFLSILLGMATFMLHINYPWSIRAFTIHIQQKPTQV